MKKSYIVLLILIAVAAFGALAWWALKPSNVTVPSQNATPSNVSTPVVVTNDPTTTNTVNANVATPIFPAQAVVTTENAAIRYAELNTEVIAFKKHAQQQDISVRSYAVYDTETTLWTVVFTGINAIDFAIQVRLTTDGTVTEARSEGG
jgi:hypothetical protein